MNWIRTAFAALLLSLGLAPQAHATVLQADLTVDNYFELYLSTDDNAFGTLIGSDDGRWDTAESFTATLTPGTTYYLHVLARDWGVLGGFLGQFELIGGGFQFINGDTTLFTDPDFWSVSRTGFGTNYSTPVIQRGGNGVSPWGFFPSIDPDASWIWDNTNCVYCTLYFSTPIFPTSSGITAVSAPATLPLALLGLYGLLRHRLRRPR